MPRTVKPPDERRQELLNIGIRLFLDKGSAGVSIQNVIQQANVATGLFYYYFKSKESFLEEAVASYVSGFSGHLIEVLVQANGSALISIQNALVELSAHFEKARPLVHDEMVDTQPIRTVMHSLLQKLTPALVRLIDRGSAQGVFHVKSPTMAASFILNGLVGVLYADKGPMTDEETVREMERMVFSALGVDVR